jgi:Uma2 family endonuclease
MNRISGTSALKEKRRYTIEDYRSWPDDQRWELIDGVPYSMSPAPRVPHQDRAGNLFNRLYNFLEGKPCKVYMAPLDIYLQDENSGEEEQTVVQPDVLAVCDPSIVKDDGIHGAPDFVAEVLSDSTANKDFSVKRELYETRGVKEYWLIQPDTCTVFQYLREGEKMQGERFAPIREFRRGEPVESGLFPGFVWNCSKE